MNTDFGVVKRYFADRGFGFVTHTFLGRQQEVFFHIKNIKKAHPELAERLDRDELSETLGFWYETEVTNKGEQVRAIIKPELVRDRIPDHLPNFVGKVEDMWKNLDAAVPSWLFDVTGDLAGIDRVLDLRSKRATLEEERRKAYEQERKEREAARKIEEAKRQKLIDEQNALRKAQEEIEEREFEQLVSEIASLKFTESAQVSAYIVRNQLGYKYKNISGILEMELDGTTWKFQGGFPPKIYARLCQELGLGNQRTRARPGKFESFKELSNKRHR